MNLKEYFESSQGVGVLATADADGRVDLAIYARPHVTGEDEVSFIMADRLSHHNLQSNPHAAYLFMEQSNGSSDAPRWQGKRLFLTRTAEEQDTERLRSMRRVDYGDDRDGRFLVSFAVDRVLPLVGSGEGKAKAKAGR